MLLTLTWILITEQPSIEALVQQGAYLQAATILKEEAAKSGEGKSIRNYATHLIDYHTQNIAFRTFALSNLGHGESLRVLRAKTKETWIQSGNFQIIEQDLETFLLRSWKLFPDDPDIKFTIAYYLHFGKCCLFDSALALYAPKNMDEVFLDAYARGIEREPLLTYLAKKAITQEGEKGQATFTLTEKAIQKGSEDPDVCGFYLQQLNILKQFEKALALSKRLIDRVADPSLKLVALYHGARAYFGLGDLANALKTLDAGLQIQPGHPLLWTMGMELGRNLNNDQQYFHRIQKFLDSSPLDPRPFDTYLTFLKLKGIHPRDRAFLDQYAAQGESEDPKVIITHQFNMGRFFETDNQHQKAMTAYDLALQAAEKMEGTEAMRQGLLHRIDQIRTRAKETNLQKSPTP